MNIEFRSKCKECSMRYLVTDTLNGGKLDKPFYQCIANNESECFPEEFKYFTSDIHRIAKFKIDVVSAREELEQKMEKHQNDDLEEIVQIYVSDGAGQYTMRDFTTFVNKDMTDEEYEKKYKMGRYFENDINAHEQEDWDFDKLLEDVNEELDEFLQTYDLVQVGFGMTITWWEGNIVLAMYPIY